MVHGILAVTLSLSLGLLHPPTKAKHQMAKGSGSQDVSANARAREQAIEGSWEAARPAVTRALS